MADIDTRRADFAPLDPIEDEYTWWEVIYWLIGIVMIPLVPILMISLFTPYSGVTQ